jgi:hypothetical protein
LLNGFDVVNRELTWHPLHLSRLSATKHDQIPQNSRKHLIVFFGAEYLASTFFY